MNDNCTDSNGGRGRAEGTTGLLELLRDLEPIDEPFPDIDTDLPRLEPVEIAPKPIDRKGSGPGAP